MTKIRPERLTAEPFTETVRVSHPRLEGHVEIVQRVIDTLAGMLKRKQLREREYLAADHYRSCHATLYGAMGGSMDFDRVRGGTNSGTQSAPPYMLASEVVSTVKRILYPKDWAVVHRICALGFSIEETTAHLYGVDILGNTTRAQRDACSGRLRAGLDVMADEWWPEHQGRGGNMRSHITERAMPTDAVTVPQARAAHATGDKVYRSGK